MLIRSKLLFAKRKAIDFQENLLKTLLQIEDTVNKAVKFYHETRKQNCIVIYDRGAMDPVACKLHHSMEKKTTKIEC